MSESNNDQLKSTAGVVSPAFADLAKEKSENSGTILSNPPLTFGQKAVGLTFNPSNNVSVDLVKNLQAEYIDVLNHLRNASTSAEAKRLFSVAITEAQTSQMYGVKAITWKD